MFCQSLQRSSYRGKAANCCALAAWIVASSGAVFSAAASPSHRTAQRAAPISAPAFGWPAAAQHGPYPLAPGVRNFEVDRPDGQTPTYNDLESLQYHHHTRVAVDRSRRIWVAYSGALRQEGESGMITEVRSSRDGRTWTSPHVVVAPASAFNGSLQAGRRISYPRAFVSYQGQMYLVAAIDQANGVGCCSNEQGEALIAVRLHRDGSVGKPFRVSAAPYTPIPGFPAYPYDPNDPTLGPALFHQANLFGTWGGSAPGQRASAWTGYGTAADGTTLVEPNTIRLRHPDGWLLRLWRDEGKIGQFELYASVSPDDGARWSPALPTGIPNSPSETTLVALTNGDIAVAGNARDNPDARDARDPLYLAIFSGDGGVPRHIYALRQGLGPPAYDNHVTCGTAVKPCGAGYPGAYEFRGKLYVSYSVDKQQIWLAIVPVSGLE